MCKRERTPGTDGSQGIHACSPPGDAAATPTGFPVVRLMK